MQRKLPEEFNFYPKTWLLPSDSNDFRQYLQTLNSGDQKHRQAFIVKPEASCQGRGIFLTLTP